MVSKDKVYFFYVRDVNFSLGCLNTLELPTTGRRESTSDAVPRQRVQNSKAKVICRTGDSKTDFKLGLW